MRPARWGIWLFCQNVCQRSETKGFCNSLLQRVSCVHGSLLLSIPRGFFLLLSFYIVISWYMSLFKAWSKDKLNKRFVVAENFAELVFKGKRFCLFPKVSDSLWTGGAFDLLNWQHSGEFDQSFSKKSNARRFARGGRGVMGGFGIDRYITDLNALLSLL